MREASDSSGVESSGVQQDSLWKDQSEMVESSSKYSLVTGCSIEDDISKRKYIIPPRRQKHQDKIVTFSNHSFNLGNATGVVKSDAVKDAIEKVKKFKDSFVIIRMPITCEAELSWRYKGTTTDLNTALDDPVDLMKELEDINAGNKSLPHSSVEDILEKNLNDVQLVINKNDDSISIREVKGSNKELPDPAPDDDIYQSDDNIYHSDDESDDNPLTDLRPNIKLFEHHLKNYIKEEVTNHSDEVIQSKSNRTLNLL